MAINAALMCGPAGTLKDVFKPSDNVWFRERFQIAAVQRYQRIESACTANVQSGKPRMQAVFLPRCLGSVCMLQVLIVGKSQACVPCLCSGHAPKGPESHSGRRSQHSSDRALTADSPCLRARCKPRLICREYCCTSAPGHHLAMPV